MAGFGRWLIGSSSWKDSVLALAAFLACAGPGSFLLATGLILLQLATFKTILLGALWLPFAICVPLVITLIRLGNKSYNNLAF